MKPYGTNLTTIAIALLVLLGGMFMLRVVDPWRAVPPPPVPPFAENLRTSYPSTGNERITEFDADQPLESIVDFYRSALTRHGWRYRCTVTPVDPPCGHDTVWSETGRVIVFDRGAPGTAAWETFEVRIDLGDQAGRYTVRFDQVLRRPPAASPPSPSDDERFRALLGDWRSTDAATGSDYSLRFDDQGRVGVLLPFGSLASQLGGTYRWDAMTLRLMFSTSGYRIAGAPEPCARTVSLLRRFCRDTVIPYATSDPAAYPGLPKSATPTNDSNRPTPTGPAGYPPPTPADTVETRVEVVFSAALDGDALTLTHPSGVAQTFQRVTGDR